MTLDLDLLEVQLLPQHHMVVLGLQPIAPPSLDGEGHLVIGGLVYRELVEPVG